MFFIVYCKSVLEHLVNPFKGLSEMKRVSKNNIMVIIPNVHHWRRIARTLCTPDKDINPCTKHFQAWDREAFRHLVNRIEDLEIARVKWGYFKGRISWPSVFFGSNMIVLMKVIN